MIIWTQTHHSPLCYYRQTVSKISFSPPNWLSPERKSRKGGRMGIKGEEEKEEALIGSRWHSDGLLHVIIQSEQSLISLSNQTVACLWCLISAGSADLNMNEALSLCDSFTENIHTHAKHYWENVCGNGRDGFITLWVALLSTDYINVTANND